MKAIVTIGYTTFVMDMDKATALMTLVGNAETYDTKYHKADDGGTTHHVYDMDVNSVSLKLMSDSMYSMAKLAGKPVG
jgi:hypothetical protein